MLDILLDFGILMELSGEGQGFGDNRNTVSLGGGVKKSPVQCRLRRATISGAN